MRPAVFTVTGVGSANPYPVDTYISPSNMGLAVIVSGTITYKVQYTFDDVFANGYVAASGNWFDHQPVHDASRALISLLTASISTSRQPGAVAAITS